MALRWRSGAKRRAEPFVAAQEAEADDEEALQWDNEDGEEDKGGNKEREACGLRCFIGADAVALCGARPQEESRRAWGSSGCVVSGQLSLTVWALALPLLLLMTITRSPVPLFFLLALAFPWYRDDAAAMLLLLLVLEYEAGITTTGVLRKRFRGFDRLERVSLRDCI